MLPLTGEMKNFEIKKYQTNAPVEMEQILFFVMPMTGISICACKISSFKFDELL